MTNSETGVPRVSQEQEYSGQGSNRAREQEYSGQGSGVPGVCYPACVHLPPTHPGYTTPAVHHAAPGTTVTPGLYTEPR